MGPERFLASTSDAIKLSLDIYQLGQNAISTYDVCQLAFGLFNRNSIDVDRLFCITNIKQFELEGSSIQFSAFIEADRSYRHYSRNLDKDDIIRKVLGFGVSLSSDDLGAKSTAKFVELADMKCWLLRPIYSVKQNRVLGLLGVSRKDDTQFSSIEKQYFDLLVETISQFELRYQAIVATKEMERERVINESARSLWHELSNEMGTIPHYVEFIAEELRANNLSYPPAIDQYLDDIRADAEAIRKKANTRLDEIIYGSYSSKVEQFNFKDLVIDIIHSMRFMGCELNEDYDSETHLVICKRRDLQDAIWNILHNAVDAMIESSRKQLNIKMTGLLDEQNQNWVKLVVTDTGGGIETELLDRIWDISYSTKGPRGGFGLFWAKFVVEDANGEITVTSRPGHGSEFQVMLPSNRNSRQL